MTETSFNLPPTLETYLKKNTSLEEAADGQFLAIANEVFVTKEGLRIPCANHSTYLYYKHRENIGEIVR